MAVVSHLRTYVVPQTNYDLLVSKTPEELARFLPEIRNALTCVLGIDDKCQRPDHPCFDCWLDWLNAPVEEVDDG